jgi:TRAP-type C4-dicarboxylate transport system permease small subunit
MNTLAKVLKGLEKNFERYFCAGALSIISIALVVQVFFRYVLRSPLTGPQELVRFLFVWFVYLGASYGVREGAHIRLSHHVSLMPEKIQRIIRVIADLCWLLFCAVIVWVGIGLVESMFRYPYLSQTFRINQAYIYIIIPFSFALMGLRTFWNIYLVATKKVPPYSVREERQQLD